MKKSLLEKIKNNEIDQSSFIYEVNIETQNLLTLTNKALSYIKSGISESKKIVDAVSTFKITSDGERILLSNLPVYSSKNLYNDNGYLTCIPEIKDSCTIESIDIIGNGSNIVDTDSSGFPVMHNKDGLINGDGFLYKSPTQEAYRIDVKIEDYYALGRIDILIDESYSSSLVDISSMETSGIPVQFKKIKTKEKIILLLEEPLKTKSLSIGILSKSIDIVSKMFVSKINKIIFSITSNTTQSEIIFGPIHNESKKIIKIGASTKTIDSNIAISFSTDLTNWKTLTKYSESSYFSNINTSGDNSLGIDASSVYIKLLYKNNGKTTKTKKIAFEEYAGKDCYKIELEAGRTTVSPFSSTGITQTIFDLNSNSYIFNSNKSSSNYRITTPFLPVSFIDTTIESELGKIIVNPNNIFFSCSSVFEPNSQNSNNKYIYEMKEEYTAGIYEVYLDDVKIYEFDIYGDFMFSISKFLFEIETTKKITVKIKNENKIYDETSMKTKELSGKKIVSIAPIFIKSSNDNKVGFFYPFSYEDDEIVVSNGVNIQNCKTVVSTERVSYPQTSTGSLSADNIISLFPKTIKSKNIQSKRSKLIKLNNKNVLKIKVSTDSILSQVPYIDGIQEFRKDIIKSVFEIINNSEVAINGNSIYDIDIYSSGYAIRFKRVYSKNDITDQYMYYVQGDKILFSSNIDGEYVNIIFKEKDDKIIEDNYFSFDKDNSRVYFSSYQNDIAIEYLYSDIYMEGSIYTTSKMFSDGTFEPVGIIEEEIEVGTVNIKNIEEFEVGIIYDSRT